MENLNEVDQQKLTSTQVIREAMIERRDTALKESNFSDAVLFSHVIAALAYCIKLEDISLNMEK